jgi:hypothetical protein
MGTVTYIASCPLGVIENGRHHDDRTTRTAWGLVDAF